MTNNKYILKRQEAADYMGIGLSTLDKLIFRRDNPLPHIKAGRRVLIPREALEKWIAEEVEREGE